MLLHAVRYSLWGEHFPSVIKYTRTPKNRHLGRPPLSLLSLSLTFGESKMTASRLRLLEGALKMMNWGASWESDSVVGGLALPWKSGVLLMTSQVLR